MNNEKLKAKLEQAPFLDAAKLGNLALKCAGCPFKRICDQTPTPSCKSSAQEILSKDEAKAAILDDSISEVYSSGKQGGGFIAIKNPNQAKILEEARRLAIPTSNRTPPPATKHQAPKQTPPPKPKTLAKPQTSFIEHVEQIITKALAKS